MIKAEGLKIAYNGQAILNGLDITINDHDIIGIIGPSGSGKSLVLRCLMMLEKPDEGKVFLDDIEITAPGADLDDARSKIGMVFQDFNLFDHMSVIENVMSGMVHVQKIPAKEAFEKAMDLLKTVGLSEKAYCYPNILSGGQKQRVAIARTLAMNPHTVLLDEPTSALDPSMRGEVEAVIRIMAAAGHPMAIVSHEMGLIETICNKVVFVNEGVVWEEGTPDEIFNNPKRTETRRFIKALRVLEFAIESKTFDFLGMNTQIREFTYRNGVPDRITSRLEAIMEELCQMVIIQPKEENRLQVSFEYNPKDKSFSGTVYFTGPLLDPDDPHYFFSWPIIQRRASSVVNSPADFGNFTNKLDIVID